jgi:hypothetical protein
MSFGTVEADNRGASPVTPVEKTLERRKVNAYGTLARVDSRSTPNGSFKAMMTENYMDRRLIGPYRFARTIARVKTRPSKIDLKAFSGAVQDNAAKSTFDVLRQSATKEVRHQGPIYLIDHRPYQRLPLMCMFTCPFYPGYKIDSSI